jgi:antitoxin component YwqK of YwqJK toxin-antitoxin module
MNKIPNVLIALSLSVIHSCYSGQNVSYDRTYFDNGIIKSEYRLVNGKRHGRQVEYYINGQARLIYRAKHGVIQGINREYHENGRLASRFNLTCDGEMIGAFISFHSNGIRDCVGRYAHMPGYEAQSPDSCSKPERIIAHGIGKKGTWKYCSESGQCRKVKYNNFYLIHSESTQFGLVPVDDVSIIIVTSVLPSVKDCTIETK